MSIPLSMPPLALLLAVMGTAPERALPFPADAPLALREEPSSQGAAPASQPAEPPPAPRLWTSLGEVTAINVGIWLTDRYLLNKEWAHVTLESLGQTLRAGFVWDTDNFGTNQFAHPYHGSLYYNAARDNGFGYVGSSLFTFLGSVQWELLSETEPAAINDLANTSLGGIALGEILYRLSSEVLDDSTTGLDRVGHELAAAVLSPSRGFNRLVHGESWRVGSEPRQEPPFHRLLLVGQFGYLKLANGTAVLQGTDQLFAQIVMRYGDPVYAEINKPFDAYSVEAQFTTKEHRLVSHSQIRGVLASTPLLSTESSRLVLGALQHFDYTNVQAYEVGGQSFSGSLLYARQLSQVDSLRAALHLKGVVLGGISSEHSVSVGRNYDYGPGLDLQLEARYLYRGWEIATAEAGMAWLHTLNGSKGQHLTLAGKVQVDFPIYRSLGVGMAGTLFQRNSFYRNFPNTIQNTSQLRVFLSLH
ncbi:MAG: DUF3943 domain-containing protein [Hyalangium sp.]|uniref:DUF3943 domain-containing protein n=1 Tax=Hyalangium sp. TaxID=2028555 RepID=UPI003899EBC9